MFVYSFKASKFKVICAVCICAVLIGCAIAMMPKAGASLNVNKIEVHEQLKKIGVKTQEGQIEYLEALGYQVQKNPVSTTEEKLSKNFDAVEEKYNDLQKLQGFDMEKYKGKKVKGYTYEVTSLPDGTKLASDVYYATLIVYKNKVIGADLCCPSLGKYSPLVTVA